MDTKIKKSKKMVTSSHKRTLVKALCWELLTFLWVTIVLWIWSGNLSTSLLINFGITIVKALGLYSYDRLWKKIQWGKICQNLKTG